MNKFLQVTCIAIAGSAASFSALADTSQSGAQNAQNSPPALCSKCEASNPPKCNENEVFMRDNKIAELCLDGRWMPGGSVRGQWNCDENGVASYSDKFPSNAMVTGGGFACSPDGKPLYAIGFIGISNSGLNDNCGVPLKDFPRSIA